MTTTTPEDLRTAGAQQLVERLFDAALGMVGVHTVYVGDRLGLYRSLASSGPATSTELAFATATDERYVPRAARAAGGQRDRRRRRRVGRPRCAALRAARRARRGSDRSRQHSTTWRPSRE